MRTRTLNPNHPNRLRFNVLSIDYVRITNCLLNPNPNPRTHPNPNPIFNPNPNRFLKENKNDTGI